VTWPFNSLGVAFRLFCAVLVIPSAVSAQAWLFPKGQGAVSLSYQNLYVADHAYENGDAHDIGHVLSHALTLDVDYSFTDKLAVRVAVPYIAARYYGPKPHQLPMDDGTYHSTLQDFTTDVRYNLTKRRVVLTPFFRVVVPSNSYTYFAHSAAGRDQREYHFGTNFGRRLDPLIPKAYMQAQYSYALVERVLGIAPNRSNFEFQLGRFPVWLGANRDDLDRLGMGLAVPATAFLDQQGHIVFRVTGPAREEELRERLDWLIGSRDGPPPVAFVRHLDE